MGEKFLKYFMPHAVSYFSLCSWYFLQNPKLTSNPPVNTLAVCATHRLYILLMYSRADEPSDPIVGASPSQK